MYLYGYRLHFSACVYVQCTSYASNNMRDAWMMRLRMYVHTGCLQN